MPTLEYPRRGRAIAPQTLRVVLCVPAPVPSADGRLLSHLNSDSWEHLGDATCREVAAAVVAQVQKELPHIIESLGRERLPRLPRGVTLSELELGSRTHMALVRAVSEDLEELQHLRFKTLMALRDFDAAALVDLLIAIETVARESPPGIVADEEVGEDLPSGSAFDDELGEMLRRCNRRNLKLVIDRFGLMGDPPRTLQEIANDHQLTRERVRQITAKFSGALGGHSLPVARKCLEFVRGRLPCAAATLEADLTGVGLVGSNFRLEQLANLAVMLNLERFTVLKTGDARLALSLKQAQRQRRIRATARKNVAHWGASTVEDVAGVLTRSDLTDADHLLVRMTIEQLPGFRWLDREAGWFWMARAPRNALLSRLRKILSIAPRVSAKEIRAGIQRDLRMGGFAPPRRVIVELCRQLGFTVEGDFVRAIQTIAPENVLSPAQLALVNLLRKHGGALTRQNLIELAEQNGISRASLSMLLQYSPIIVHLAHAIYGLVGADVRPSDIERLSTELPVASGTRVLTDFGWTSEGRVWIGATLSKSVITTAMVTTPASLRALIEGRFALTDEEGIGLGNLGVNETRIWGLGPLLRRRGGEIGDTLLLEFDLKKRTAIAVLGGEELLERHQGPQARPDELGEAKEKVGPAAEKPSDRSAPARPLTHL